MSSFAKDCLQPLVNRISIKTLKYWLSFWPISQNTGTCLGKITYTFSFISCNVGTMVTNQSKNIYSVTLTPCVCAEYIHWFVSHTIYLSLGKPTMQQCFYLSAKHLLYRYVAPSFAGHSFRVLMQVKLGTFSPIHRCEFWFLFDLKNISVSLCKYNS